MSNTAPTSPQNISFPLFFLLMLLPVSVRTESTKSETEVLLKLKQQWGTVGFIQMWDPTVPHCYWPGILCIGNSVTGILLRNQNITDSIPAGICGLTNLTTLDVSDNLIPGAFPAFLYNCSKLQTLNISHNHFQGPLPGDIHKLSNLQTLDISENEFSGDIPSAIGQLTSLTTLNLESNFFNGTIPPEIGDLRNLEKLDMSYNTFVPTKIPVEFGRLKKLNYMSMRDCNLIGEVPGSLLVNLTSLRILSLASNRLSGQILLQLSVNLEWLDLSSNQFSGTIPLELTALSKLTYLILDNNQFSGELPSTVISWKSLVTLSIANNELSGKLPAALGSLPKLKRLVLSSNRFSGHIPRELGRLNLHKLDLSSNNLSGEIPSVLDDVAYLLSFDDNPKLCSDIQVSNLSRCPSSRQRNTSLSLRYLAVLLPAAAIILVIWYFLVCKVNVLPQEKQNSDHAAWIMTPFQDLNFREADIMCGLTENNVVGSGGSGKVYCLKINDSGDKVAVKRIWNRRKLGNALEKQFLVEVEILGTIRHTNIVKLLCCFSSEDSMLLVYEYMENQSLDKWLHKKKIKHDTSSMSHVLDWPKRLRIAIGVAKGLCYIHHGCSPPIIHRDVKSSNILLDSEFNAKIADFGLAKISVNKAGEPHTVSAVAGTFGYIAPEYWRTRRLNEKIDIFSFGCS